MHRTVTNRVSAVEPGSPAADAGIAKGDRVLSVNGTRIRDNIDFLFCTQEAELLFRLQRGSKRITRIVRKDDQFEDTGIAIEQLKTDTCRNNCIFCFVSQLPRGLRRSLYVKDEDYRMSFLFGNYVTLGNLSSDDRSRIVRQKLSPLYISVHTTNQMLRRFMLGNSRARDIMKELSFFAGHGIRFHAQIVLCPGLNDGQELERTIRDLATFFPSMLSVAVVPVGLTEHRRKRLAPVEAPDARQALALIRGFQERYLGSLGDALVYGADELYIKGGIRFPSVRLYGDFPQMENGVGMVPFFLHRSRSARRSAFKPAAKHFVVVTGTSFFPFLEKEVGRLQARTGCNIRVLAVKNRFFGESVTVTGLLTGRDVINDLRRYSAEDETVLIPDVVFRDSGDMMLDNITREDLGQALRREVRVIEPTMSALMKSMEE